MARRDEFDDDGFFDRVKKRDGAKTAMPGDLRKILKLVIGVVVFAVIAAIIWSSLRNTSAKMGEVPIIRAETGPMKVAPEDRGGMEVANKKSTIYDTLKAQEDDAKVENLLEDGEQPVPKEQVFANTPPVAAAPVENSVDQPVTDEAASSNPAAVKTSDDANMPPQPDTPDADAVMNQDLAVKPEAVAPVVSPEPVTPAPVKPEPVVTEPVKAEPKPKPVEPAYSPPAPVAKAPAASAPVAKTPAASAPAATGGSTYIQLASVKSEADANSQWTGLKAKNPELGGLSLRVQKADLGAKGVFYRIQAGPLSPASAQSTCSSIKSRGGTCLVAK